MYSSPRPEELLHKNMYHQKKKTRKQTKTTHQLRCGQDHTGEEKKKRLDSGSSQLGSTDTICTYLFVVTFFHKSCQTKMKKRWNQTRKIRNFQAEFFEG